MRENVIGMARHTGDKFVGWVCQIAFVPVASAYDQSPGGENVKVK